MVYLENSRQKYAKILEVLNGEYGEVASRLFRDSELISTSINDKVGVEWMLDMFQLLFSTIKHLEIKLSESESALSNINCSCGQIETKLEEVREEILANEIMGCDPYSLKKRLEYLEMKVKS